MLAPLKEELLVDVLAIGASSFKGGVGGGRVGQLVLVPLKEELFVDVSASWC